MIKFLLGMVTAAGAGKWIESKTDNKPLSVVSEILLCFVLIKILRRK